MTRKKREHHTTDRPVAGAGCPWTGHLRWRGQVWTAPVGGGPYKSFFLNTPSGIAFTTAMINRHDGYT